MATTLEKRTKDGKLYFEIRVSRGRDKSRLTKRWYAPEGWSRKAIDRELARVAHDFEKEVQSGQVLSREEQRKAEAAAAAEAAKIQTLRQYGEQVFMPQKTVSISENSRSSFQGCLNNRIYPVLGDRKLPEITAADIGFDASCAENLSVRNVRLTKKEGIEYPDSVTTI